MSSADPSPDTVVPGMTEPLSNLLGLRESLLAARDNAVSPAITRALEMADTYLFLAISYLGYTDELFPEER